MGDVYREIVRILDGGERAALATIISTQGSSPGKEAMKLLIREDGTSVGTVGGGCVEADVYDVALEVLRTGRSRTLEFALTEKGLPGGGLVCGGKVTVFVESITAPTLYIFGAGHVSLSLCRVAATAGFRVVVLDDREAFASRERFPDATEVRVLEGFDDALDGVNLTKDAYVVIVTRGHQHDEMVLRQVVGRPTAYLGLIGSRTKLKKLFRKMETEGVDPSQLRRVHGPIGLDIGARTPEEIGVAIVAEMIAVRREALPERGADDDDASGRRKVLPCSAPDERKKG